MNKDSPFQITGAHRTGEVYQVPAHQIFLSLFSNGICGPRKVWDDFPSCFSMLEVSHSRNEV